MRFILTFLIIINTYVYSQDTQDIVSEMKDAQIEEDFILSDNEFKECDTSKGKTEYDAELKKCVENKVSLLEEEQLNEFSNKYKLKAFNPEAAQSKKSLQAYLSERIQNAIYGEKFKKDPKLKNMKYVDQKHFFELYKNQIGKNILLEISRYSMENYATTDPSFITTPILNHTSYDKNAKLIFFDTEHFSEEYKCKNTADTNCRTSKQVEDFKKKQLEFAQNHDDGPAILGKHFINMRDYIGAACEYYRCKEIYTQSTHEDNLIQCNKIFKVKTFEKNISIENSVTYKPGQVACAVENKMKAYRRTLSKVDEILKQISDKEFESKRGFDLGVAFGGQFVAGKDGDKSFDELTAISSKELVDNVDEFNKDKLSKKQEELRKECFEDGEYKTKNKDCSILLEGSLSADELKQLETDQKLQTQIYLAQLDKLKERAAKDKEELRSFLEKHGLSNKFTDLSDVNPDEVVELIKGKYAAERLSIVENLRLKFQRKTDANSEDDESKKISDFASSQLDNLTAESDNIESLFNYSNIASSYLQVTNGEKGDSEEKTENSVMRSIEAQGFEKYASDEDKDENKYEVFFEDTDSSSSASAGADVELDFIDRIIGN